MVIVVILSCSFTLRWMFMCLHVCCADTQCCEVVHVVHPHSDVCAGAADPGTVCLLLFIAWKCPRASPSAQHCLNIPAVFHCCCLSSTASKYHLHFRALSLRALLLSEEFQWLTPVTFTGLVQIVGFNNTGLKLPYSRS